MYWHGMYIGMFWYILFKYLSSPCSTATLQEPSCWLVGSQEQSASLVLQQRGTGYLTAPHTSKGEGPPHPSRGVGPKVLDGIVWTMTTHSLASLLDTVCGVGGGGGGPAWAW